MKKRKILKIAAIVIAAGLVIGVSVGLYLYFMPHRDVQKSTTDHKLSASELVAEYLADWDAANKKYLAEDGESKILEITGTVARISEDFTGRKVVLLREKGDQAGVSCTFLAEATTNAEKLSKGQKVTIKGVIRSGVSFDRDLDMYLNAVVFNSDLVIK